jgi:murein L,D-transpeptidase YcbB/YkuD
VVNTCRAKVYVVAGGSVVFETRAIVGKEYTKTPLFSAALRTVELDPTWTVPPAS